MKTIRRDWISGLILLAVSIIYYQFADHLPHSMLSDEVGADGYPKMLAVALAVFSVIVTISGILKKVPDTENGKTLSEKDKHTFKRAGGAISIAIAYLILLSVFGYFLSVGLLFATVVIYNGGKFSKKLIIISIGGAIFFWVFFVILLDVPMPNGVWMKLFS